MGYIAKVFLRSMQEEKQKSTMNRKGNQQLQ